MNCFLSAELVAGWPSREQTTLQLCVLVSFQQDPELPFAPAFSRHEWDRESWCCLSFDNWHPPGQRTRNPSYHCFSLKAKQNLKEQFWKIVSKSLVLKIEPVQQLLNSSPIFASWKKAKIIYCPWGHSERLTIENPKSGNKISSLG